MNVAIGRPYGPARVAVEAVADPVPGPAKGLVAVEATGLTTGDVRIRGARAPGGMGPVIRLVFGQTGPRRAVPGRNPGADVALNDHSEPMPGPFGVVPMSPPSCPTRPRAFV